MRFLIIGLVYLGYGFTFWGTTLLAGGPGNTGSWSLMYSLFGLGTAPQSVKQGGQTATDTGSAQQRQFEAGGAQTQTQESAGTRRPGKPF